MTTIVVVNVTRENIDQGEWGALDSCPIALAMSDMGLQSPTVWIDWVMFGIHDLYGNIVKVAGELPQTAQTFVRVFDSHSSGRPRPFSFELKYYD